MFGFGYSKDKSRAAAEKYLQQNKLQHAITEYEKILKEEPKEYAIMNTVGDLYARLGKQDKATECFKTVGDSYIAEGSTVKAIALYKKITKLDPNGLAAMEKLAELYRKQGLVSDARSQLLLAAEAYTRKGQQKETLRLLKQLVLFDPENVQVITRTSELLLQGGQREEAREMLSRTSATLIQRRALEPALKILDRLLALDRNNLRAQEMRAQVTCELGRYDQAIELYEAIPDLDSRDDALRNLIDAYLQTGNLDAAEVSARKLMTVHHNAEGVVKVASRLYKENETLRTLALYNEFCTEALAQDKEDVLAHLHGAASRVRNNPDALHTLYTLFQRAGESSMLAEVLELLAHAAVQNNQLERARDAYRELLELEPENASHAQGYRQVCALMGSSGELPPIHASRLSNEPKTLDEFLHTSEPELPPQSYLPEVEEQIAAALTEAELCDSYASKARGIAALESALHSAPDDLRLNRTLAKLYAQEGQEPASARCYAVMHRVLESLGAVEAAGYYANLAGASQTTTWDASNGEFAPRDFDLGAPAAGATEEIDISGEWESVWQEASEPQTPAAPPAPYAPPPAYSSPAATAQHEFTPAAPAPAAGGSSVQELVEEVKFCLDQQIWPEAESAIARLTAAAPQHPELPALCARFRQGNAARELPPVDVIDVDAASPFAPPAPAAPPSLNSLAADLDAELGDDFTPVQGHREPPRPAAVPQQVPEPAPMPVPQAPAAAYPQVPPAGYPAYPPQGYPGYPAPGYPAPGYPQGYPAPAYGQPMMPPVVAQVPQMSASAAPAPEPEPEPMVPSVFGDLLQDFERELAAPANDADDPETHFNLGIAFREMGLLDEAIGELQKVCRDTNRHMGAARLRDAYIWLATCFVEKGIPEASFKWFHKALESATNDESRTAVTYELASAYEAAGLKKEALQHFLEVYGNNIDYRDVAGRIRELRTSV
ncbi:MAG: tetratricopeptide repeat protein [Acidobacteriota bacterium]|nr:tetratricopeptide repeat protein [Acidobacteriota bacterium]